MHLQMSRRTDVGHRVSGYDRLTVYYIMSRRCRGIPVRFSPSNEKQGKNRPEPARQPYKG